MIIRYLGFSCIVGTHIATGNTDAPPKNTVNGIDLSLDPLGFSMKLGT